MDGNHFGVLLGLIAAWSLVIIATARWTISAAMKGVAEKFDAQKKKMELQDEKRELLAKETQQELKAQGEKQQRLEREVLEVKADLPVCYVRREDFIRHEVTINTKLDRLRDLIMMATPKKETME